MKKSLISAVVITAGLLLGGASTAFASNYFDIGIKSEQEKNYEWAEPTYDVNINGETYGSNFNVQFVEDWPDLIKARGDNGVEGYIRASDLEDESPSSPEEAIKRQQAREKKGASPRVINLYDKDGEEVVDTFTCGKSLLKSEK